MVEPLNRAECNVLTTLAECAALVEAAEHPAIRLMVDAYHLLRDGDALADIVTCGKLLAHAHIATVPGRSGARRRALRFLPLLPRPGGRALLRPDIH